MCLVASSSRQTACRATACRATACRATACRATACRATACRATACRATACRATGSLLYLRCLANANNPAPPAAAAGIVRPTAHSLPMVGHNLLAEMASQLGKLTQLATELKSENQQLVSVSGCCLAPWCIPDATVESGQKGGDNIRDNMVGRCLYAQTACSTQTSTQLVSQVASASRFPASPTELQHKQNECVELF
jgi:hypothetical protein